MSNEQNRGTPILSLEDVGGVQSTSMLKTETSSDLGVSALGSKDLAPSADGTQDNTGAHHTLDSAMAGSASAIPDTNIYQQHAIDTVDSSETAGASSVPHAVLDNATPGHADSFVFASVSGNDVVNLNDSFSSQDVVHSQLGASATDYSASAASSPLWSENLLAEHSRQGTVGQNTEIHAHSQPYGSGGGDPDGQLWAADDGDTSGNPDGHSDARIEHMDSDGLANDQVDSYPITSTGAFDSVGLDTAAGLYFAEDNSDNFYVGHMSTGANLTETTIASTSDEDITNSFVVDPAINTIFMDLDGGDYTADGGDIIKITYNSTTGSISSPYNPSNFAINLNDVLVDSTSSGGIYQDGRAFALSTNGQTLYYVDDDDNNPGSAFSADTNGIYKVSLTTGSGGQPGDVGQGTAPTPVLLSSNTQFPTNDSAGYITGIAVNDAQNLIYFTTDASAEGVNTSQDAIWVMSTSGGTATKMTLPGGVSLDYASFFSENLTFDPNARTLYVADQERDAVIQLTLNAAGTGFSSGNNDFYTVDADGDGASTYALTWGSLVTETGLAGTSTKIVQGGSAVTLATTTPSTSDPEGSYLTNLSGYTIEVIGGAKGNGTTFGVTSGAIASAAGLSGDELYINGQQSGTLDGGLVTITWNNSTQTLTLSGDVSAAEYKALLSQVTFQENANTDNTSGSHPTRVIDFIANDGMTIDHPTTTDPNEQTITVTLDRAPTVVTESYSVLESGSAIGTSGTGGSGGLDSDSDLDGDTLTITAISGSAGNVGASVAGTYGHLTMGSNGSFTYNADNTSAINSAATGTHPVDTFTYTVSDGDGGTTTQTISFTIDRPPAVVTESGSALESGSASGGGGTSGGGGLQGDSDPDGDSLTIVSVAGSAGNVGASVAGTYGHMTMTSTGAYSYTADNTSAINGAITGSHPVDTFTYTVSDGHGGTTTQTINITIDRPPTIVTESAAVVESNSASGTAGTAGTGALDGDSDADGDSLTIIGVTGGTVGTALNGTYGQLTLNANGSYTYNANNTSAINSAATGSHPVDSFTYTVSDGHGGSELQTINITIDRPPSVGASGTATFTEGGSAVAVDSGATATDLDGDHLTGATISISSNYLSGDTLNFTTQNGITGVYSAGTLTLSGSATAANYQTALDSITYSFSPSNGDPTNGGTDNSRTVSWQVTSTTSTSATTTSTINTQPPAPVAVSDAVDHNDINSSGEATYTVTFSEAVSGLTALDVYENVVTTGSVSVGELQITQNSANTYSVEFSNMTGNGTLQLVIPAGDVQNSYGEATTSAYDASNIITIDNTAPTVSSLGATATSSANFATAHTVTFTMDLSENVTVANGTTLALSDGGTATYVSGSGTQTLTFTYSATDAPQALTVSGISAGSITDGAGNSASVSGASVSPYTDAVTDSAANVAANFTSLNSAVSYISSITLNDSGTPNLDLTAAEIVNDQTLIGKIVSSYNLIANDTASTIGSDFDSLETYASSISAVIFTDGGTPTLDLTQTQVTNDASLLAKVQGPYDLYVTGVTGQAYGSYLSDYNASDTLTVKTEYNTNSTESIYAYVSRLTLAGDSATDKFYLESAAKVTVTGGSGNDTFFFGSGFSSFDHITGGSGTNTLTLDGTYSSLSISSSMMSNIQTLHLAGNHSYDVTLDAGVLTTGEALTVQGMQLLAGNSLTIDASAIAGGTLTVSGGAGADDLTGGAGTNLFLMGANLTASDALNGGTGTTTVSLDGDYSGGLSFTATTMVNVGTLDLTGNHSYDLVMNAATVASGQMLTVLGTALTSGSDNMTFDGSNVTDGGTFLIRGGAGDNTLTGGSGNDTIYAGNGTNFITGGGGADRLIAGTGADTFAYNAVSDSTSTTHDTIVNFNTSGDLIGLGASVTAPTIINTAVTTGNLSNTNFDSALAHDIGAAQLSAHGAVLFTASSGGLAGDTFLIIDENGVAGYQAGSDIVIELTHGLNLSSLSTANFETLT